MSDTQKYFVVKHITGNCEIVPSELVGEGNSEIIEQWRPFTSPEEAIAHRVGLIRAGKCQPH
ncbi:MAG: DDE transposase family protein [Trichormus sp. ATA11-4-KO1]|jgi:hypothetical protein|nr:DDE transposase family protein [Trichormus sp. ATA11-4-KO1]